MSNEVLSFVLEREERPVTIGGEAYVLIELDGKERDKYLNVLGGRLRHGPDGKAGGVKDFDGLQASLIAASLCKVVGSERVPVKQHIIQSWPARVVSGLFEAARDLSALDEKEKDEAKND